jgi:hypothetical protein
LCQEAEWTVRLEDLNSRIHELQSVNSKRDDRFAYLEKTKLTRRGVVAINKLLVSPPLFVCFISLVVTKTLLFSSFSYIPTVNRRNMHNIRIRLSTDDMSLPLPTRQFNFRTAIQGCQFLQSVWVRYLR